jgi:hypothetical protein
MHTQTQKGCTEATAAAALCITWPAVAHVDLHELAGKLLPQQQLMAQLPASIPTAAAVAAAAAAAVQLSMLCWRHNPWRHALSNCANSGPVHK